MTATHPSHDLRRRYHGRIRRAGVVAILLHGIAFAAAPPYSPRPAVTRPAPLRLVTTAGGWSFAPGRADAPENVPTPPPPRADRASASIVRSSVTTEPATVAIATDAGGARAANRGAALPSGTPGDGAGGLEEEAPPVFYDFDTAPRAIRRVEPEYPLAARIRDEEGTVVVNVNVDERGRILRGWVAAKHAPETLVSAALDAAYQFEFTPGKQRGIPVKCTIAIPFRFSLKQIQ